MAQIISNKRFFILTFVFIISFILLTRISWADDATCRVLSETECVSYNFDHPIVKWDDGCYWITCGSGAAPINGTCDNPVPGYCSNSIPSSANGFGGNNSGGDQEDESDIEVVDATVTIEEIINPCLM